MKTMKFKVTSQIDHMSLQKVNLRMFLHRMSENRTGFDENAIIWANYYIS